MEDMLPPFFWPAVGIIVIVGIVLGVLREVAGRLAQSAIEGLVYWLRDLFR